MDSVDYVNRTRFCDSFLFDFERFIPSGFFKEASFSYAITEYLKWKQQLMKQIYDNVYFHVALWNKLANDEKTLYTSPDQFLQKYRCFCTLEITIVLLNYVEKNISSIFPIWKSKHYPYLYQKWKFIDTPVIQINMQLRYLSFEFGFLENCHLTSFEKTRLNHIRGRVRQLQSIVRKRCESMDIFMQIFYLGNARMINLNDIRRSIYEFL
ncbi:MAG: hypothetical protein CMM15_13425 [Rhodospirillaceae bacterium]|nr:hypothetical protein [Rhodospirillaceae bacterium]